MVYLRFVFRYTRSVQNRRGEEVEIFDRLFLIIIFVQSFLKSCGRDKNSLEADFSKVCRVYMLVHNRVDSNTLNRVHCKPTRYLIIARAI